MAAVAYLYLILKSINAERNEEQRAVNNPDDDSHQDGGHTDSVLNVEPVALVADVAGLSVHVVVLGRGSLVVLLRGVALVKSLVIVLISVHFFYDIN